jgi:hypothetical protein
MSYLLTKQRPLVLVIEDLNGEGFGVRCEGHSTSSDTRETAILKAKARVRAVRSELAIAAQVESAANEAKNSARVRAVQEALAEAERTKTIRTPKELAAIADAAAVAADVLFDTARREAVRTPAELTATADAAEAVVEAEHVARRAAQQAEDERVRGQAQPAGGGR